MCSRLDDLAIISRHSRKLYKRLSNVERMTIGDRQTYGRSNPALYMAVVGLSVSELALVQCGESSGDGCSSELISSRTELEFSL